MEDITMNKKKILEVFPIPNEIPTEILKKINKCRRANQNRSYVTYEEGMVGKKQIKVVTFYNKNIQYYHCADTNIVRFFFSDNDFIIADQNRIGKAWGQYIYQTDDPGRYYLSECITDSVKIYDDDSIVLLYDMIKDKITDYDLKNSDLVDVLEKMMKDINSEQTAKRNARKEQKQEMEKQADMKLFRKKIPKRAERLLAKNIPVYLFEYQEDNVKKCYCTKCKTDVILEKFDKHKTKKICSGCGETGEVQRTSQCRFDFEYHQYCIHPTIVDEHTTIVRFYLLEQRFFSKSFKDNDYTIKEAARAVYKDKGLPHLYASSYSGFKRVTKNSSNFKMTAGMWGWYPNKWYYGNGIIYDTGFFKKIPSWDYELKQYPNIQNVGLKNAYKENWYWLELIEDLSKHEPELIEKFTKVGLGYLVNSYNDMWYIAKHPHERELHKIMGVDKNIFRYIMKNKLSRESVRMLAGLKKKNIPWNEEIYSKCKKLSASYEQYYNKQKVLNYMIKNNLIARDYEKYIRLLNELKYPQTKLYLYPRDFNKMFDVVLKDKKARDAEKAEQARLQREKEIQRRIVEEQGIRRQKIKELKKDKTLTDLTTEQNRKMHLICEGLRKMSDIGKFLNGSSGLLVKVPETMFELKQEGINLANCIGSDRYENSIPNGDTIIFFIRQIDEPDDPYYAMEYKNGQIFQIHGYANCNPPKELHDFCVDFEKYLQKKHFNPAEFLKAA